MSRKGLFSSLPPAGMAAFTDAIRGRFGHESAQREAERAHSRALLRRRAGKQRLLADYNRKLRPQVGLGAPEIARTRSHGVAVRRTHIGGVQIRQTILLLFPKRRHCVPRSGKI
jgi:hypothetical protein